MKIHVPFLEGVLKLNCKTCSAICCKGLLTLATTKKEFKILNQRFSSLGHFTRPIYKDKKSRKGVLGFSIPTFSSCRFLGKKYCKIYKENSNNTRPAVCRLYPFIDLIRCNDVLIVSPRGFDGCLTVIKRNAKNSRTNNERKEILHDVKKIIKMGFATRKIGWSKQRFELEKAVLRLSRLYLDKSNYIEFTFRQFQAAEKDLDLVDIKKQLENKISIWKEFLKIENSDLENKKITHELTALTPILRLEQWKINEEALPVVLFALYLSMVLFSRHNPRHFCLASYRLIFTNFACKLTFLREDQKTKIKLLQYAGMNKKKINSLVKKFSLAELAELLKLNIGERLGFISALETS